MLSTNTDDKKIVNLIDKEIKEAEIRMMNSLGRAMYGDDVYFGAKPKATKWTMFKFKIQRKIKDVRVWIGEKIAGEKFYDEY
jgi:hypothetical protein